MLRRWLAVLRAQQDDPARPASPSSSASASTAPDPPSDPEPDPDPETDWDALTLAADESGDAARAGADQDASHGVDLGVDPSDARDPTRLVFSAADADASSTTYSAPGFEPDRDTNHDTRIATVSFRFRDVLIRSRALERLVEAYARRPAASTVESALLLELFRATTMDDAVADALGDGLRRAAAAVAARDAEVQLRDEDFVGMLVAAAASVKLEGEAETLRVAKGTLDAELERAAEDVARATTHARERSDDDGNPTMGIEPATESRQRSGSNAAEVVADADGAASPTSRDVAATSRDVVAATSRDVITTTTPRDTSTAPPCTAPPSTAPPSAAPPPTAALASATRRALSLARRAFAAASTRREKIHQSAGIEPTASADALRRLRAASETLAVAKRDVAALSEESRARLLEAETFADAKSAHLRARAEDARRAHAALDDERAALAARLAELTTRTDAAFHVATHAEEELAAFESSDATVRATLETRVRDLASRGAEYDAEAAAVAATTRAVETVAAARVRAMADEVDAADACEAKARERYVVAARMHGEGLVGAARLCLRRCVFCADEAADAGAKLARADQLGLGAEVAADLRAGARSVVKKYLEAEEGARAVFAAAKITRRDAETVAPGATKAERASGFESESSFPRGALADVFAEMDALREDFEALERPEMAAWGMESEEGEGEESEEEGERTEAENGTEAENEDGGVGADDPTAPAPQEPREAEEVEEAEEAEEVENTTEFAEEVHPEAHHPEAHHPEAHRLEAPEADPRPENPENPDDPEDLDEPDEVERTAIANDSEETRKATDDAPIDANDDENDGDDDVDDWLSEDGDDAAKGETTEAAEDDDGVDAWPDVDAPAVARTADAPAVARTADTSASRE